MTTKSTEKVNRGLCAGGPKNGQMMEQSWIIERVMIPIAPPPVDVSTAGVNGDKPFSLGFTYQNYIWHPLLSMWIWDA